MKEKRACSYLRLSAFLCGLFSFPAHAEDVREIIRRAFDLNQKTEELSRNYTFLQTEHVRMLDGRGKVKRETWKTEDITLLEGSPYRRVVARNGQPLTLAEQKQEDERLRWSDEQRRKETPQQRERRLAEARRRDEQRTGPFREAREAFDFKLAGEETVNGVPVYVIDATPKRGYTPKTSAASILEKLNSRLWISKSDYGLVKVAAETLGTVSWGGIVLRLAKGSRVEIEQERVADDLWLRKRIAVDLSGRVMLVSAVHAELEFTYRDYKKFQADSRMLPGAVPISPGK
jgi:hypothetical protein